VTRDDEFGWYRSARLPARALGGAMCHIVVGGYDADPAKDEFQHGWQMQTIIACLHQWLSDVNLWG
jgi:hypothetical protein